MYYQNERDERDKRERAAIEAALAANGIAWQHPDVQRGTVDALLQTNTAEHVARAAVVWRCVTTARAALEPVLAGGELAGDAAVALIKLVEYTAIFGDDPHPALVFSALSFIAGAYKIDQAVAQDMLLVGAGGGDVPPGEC